MDNNPTKKRKISPEEAVQILERGGLKVSVEEAKKILELLYILANLEVDHFLKQ